MSAQLEHYRKLHDALSDMIEGGRLTNADIPGDYAALVRLLTTVPADDDGEARDAARYRFLREQPIDSIERGGIFVGLTPQNIVANGADLDARMDAAMGAQAEPKVWTVLLSRPDYIAADNLDTFMTHVEAETPANAVLAAQKEAYEHDYDESEREEGIGSADDYAALLVIEGKHMDVKP